MSLKVEKYSTIYNDINSVRKLYIFFKGDLILTEVDSSMVDDIVGLGQGSPEPSISTHPGGRKGYGDGLFDGPSRVRRSRPSFTPPSLPQRWVIVDEYVIRPFERMSF